MRRTSFSALTPSKMDAPYFRVSIPQNQVISEYLRSFEHTRALESEDGSPSAGHSRRLFRLICFPLGNGNRLVLSQIPDASQHPQVHLVNNLIGPQAPVLRRPKAVLVRADAFDKGVIVG